MRTAQNTSVTSDKIAQTQRTQIYHTSDFYRRRRDEQRKGSDAAAARSGGELYCRQVSNLLLESKLLCTFESRGKARAATVRISGSEEQRRRGAAAARSSGGEELRLAMSFQKACSGSSTAVASTSQKGFLAAAAAPRRCCSSPLPLLLAAAAAPRRCCCWALRPMAPPYRGRADIYSTTEKIARPFPFTVQAPRFKDPNVHPPFLTCSFDIALLRLPPPSRAST